MVYLIWQSVVTKYNDLKNISFEYFKIKSKKMYIKDIEEIINEGNKSRTVASTNMNAESSRSHAVFCVKVSQNIIDTESNVSQTLFVNWRIIFYFI
jgi:hypothetical protein